MPNKDFLLNFIDVGAKKSVEEARQYLDMIERKSQTNLYYKNERLLKWTRQLL